MKKMRMSVIMTEMVLAKLRLNGRNSPRGSSVLHHLVTVLIWHVVQLSILIHHTWCCMIKVKYDARHSIQLSMGYGGDILVNAVKYSLIQRGKFNV